MPRLYLMRHGQTQFNVEGRVQGHADSPLTELGVKQAKAAARWFCAQGVHFCQLCASPLGRTASTARIVRMYIEQSCGNAAKTRYQEHRRGSIRFLPGLIERSYGAYEAKMHSLVPADLWDPGEELVSVGGEGSAAVRRRMVDTLTRVMLEADGGDVLAVSHGSATLQFKKAWEHLATCDQDVPLGNCCILVYEFDPRAKTFVCEQIINHDL